MEKFNFYRKPVQVHEDIAACSLFHFLCPLHLLSATIVRKIWLFWNFVTSQMWSNRCHPDLLVWTHRSWCLLSKDSTHWSQVCFTESLCCSDYLVHWSLYQVVQLWSLARIIVSCSWAKHFILKVPLFSQVYTVVSRKAVEWKHQAYTTRLNGSLGVVRFS